MKSLYCQNFLKYKRRDSSVIYIGGIPMGGDNPIRIQSMTNTDTSNIEESTKQIIRIANEGADYVRLTVPAQNDVESLISIKTELTKAGIKTPLIADIHFNARLAQMAAAIVDKVRINPGNFIDRKFIGQDHTQEDENNLHKLRIELLNLIDICRENNTTIRIGTNHGSLSDRIVNKYGDTIEGMVESAMEYLRICDEVGYGNIVVSMKASNTRIMVFATRLLVSKMADEGMIFPVHLGVTEAGEGEDGRIRSAVGIGALLADGIGETVRVSLTEDPELEIPVAKKLVNYFSERENHALIPEFGKYPLNPFEYNRRKSIQVENIGGNNVPVVISYINGEINSSRLAEIGWDFESEGRWKFSDLSPDYIIVDSWPENINLPNNKRVVFKAGISATSTRGDKSIIFSDLNTFSSIDKEQCCFVSVKSSELLPPVIEKLKQFKKLVLILETDNTNGFADQRAAIIRLINLDCRLPVILKRSYSEIQKEDFQLKAASDLGGLFIDGLGDGIWLENPKEISVGEVVSTSFGILQASRVRTSKTEYISCPSCGRTLFDLQTTTRKIREKTNHLKGLKIGIMGCIVNGPGEMADADYGYVGTGIGKVNLYKEKEVIKKNVPEKKAVDELINLIKENGDWVEP